MVTITNEEALRRVKALEESSTFSEAAVKLGIPVTTLKAWARRNPKYVPKALYESRYVLTEGERLARRHTLPRATAAAARARRRPRKETRPSKVEVRPAEMPISRSDGGSPWPDWIPAGRTEFVDWFVDHIVALRERRDHLAGLLDEAGEEKLRLQSQINRLEGELAAYREAPTDEQAALSRLSELKVD